MAEYNELNQKESFEVFLNMGKGSHVSLDESVLMDKSKSLLSQIRPHSWIGELCVQSLTTSMEHGLAALLASRNKLRV